MYSELFSSAIEEEVENESIVLSELMRRAGDDKDAPETLDSSSCAIVTYNQTPNKPKWNKKKG